VHYMRGFGGNLEVVLAWQTGRLDWWQHCEGGFCLYDETKRRFETGVNDGSEAQQLQQIFVTHLLCFYCTKYFS
jgi:hypothetical protein